VVLKDSFVALELSFCSSYYLHKKPYVKVYVNGLYKGQTRVIEKNLNPSWNEKFKIHLSTDESNKLLAKMRNNGGEGLDFYLLIFDKDELSDDDSMGIVRGNLSLTEPPSTNWMKVETAPYHSKPVTGELQVKTAVSIRKMLTTVRGNSISLNGETVNVKLDWRLEGGSNIDLDTSCVAVARNGNILMDETVYFSDLVNSNASLLHSGDVQSGGKSEVITCKLGSIKQHVKALYFILTVATPGKSFEDVNSASVAVVNDSTKCTLCNFTPSLVGDHTAMFLMRIMRKDTGHGWILSIIEDTDHTARDFGSLIPEIKAYSKDFAPGIVIDPRERIALMRKGGSPIRLRDYSSPNQPVPNKVTFGLAWDITNGRNVDLDASAICLDASFRPVDTIYFRKLRSYDNAILHGGDEREGDERGDDEKIHLWLQNVNPSVAHIGFVVNSYSGQELDDVSRASCHLFDSETKVDIASYKLSNNHALDKHTGLVMASLYRDDDDWCMRIISEAAHGRQAQDLIDELQAFLRNNPPPPPAEVPEPEIVVNQMPEDVEIVVEPAVAAHEIDTSNIFIPPIPTAAKPPAGGVFVPTY